MTVGVDVLDVWTGQLTLRRLRVILDHLPQTSAYKQALTGGPHYEPQQVLADIYDLLAHVNSDPKRGRPKRYPRPGDEVREERLRAEQVARLQQLSRQAQGGGV